MKKILFSYIFLLTLSFSCKKDDVKPVDIPVTPEMARDSLFDIMKQWYYWYNMPEAMSVTTANKGNYPDPYALLNAMRYKKLDRWSYIQDYDEFNAEMNGTFVGHGISIGVDDSGNARIVMIYSRSPLYAEGVRRGWIVKEINGTNPAPALKPFNSEAYSNLIRPAQAGITNKFLFIGPDGKEKTIFSTKTTFTINTVVLYEKLELSSGTAGHLVFDYFIDPSLGELATAFKFFKDNGVKDLILDLRYNIGGFFNVAQTLASYIAGNSRQGAIFAKLQYNDKNQNENFSYPFITTSYSLDLKRLVVITSHATASASESLMNGLKPYMNVVSIGDTTGGKPTAMDGWPIGKKYWMWPVTINVVNSQNQGDFFDGIYPTKTLPDDITRDFNDREEVCLKEAIHYLETGSVSTKGAEPFKRNPHYSEKPAWMNNAFIKNR